MLKRWIIEDFKSFCGKAEFDLSPITVLSGANSSGKSTLIQALLLVKQTIQHGAPQRSIALNGPILRLGRFDDIHNVESNSSHFGFGGTLTRDLAFPESTTPFRWIPELSPKRPDMPEEISLYSTFHVNTEPSTDEIPRLYPELRSCEFSFSSEDEVFEQDSEDDELFFHTISTVRSLKLRSSPRTVTDKLSNLGINNPIASYDDSLKYDVIDIDNETASSIETFPNSQLLGCGVRQFFPGPLAFSYDRSTWKARQIAQSIVSHLRRSPSELHEEPIPNDVVAMIRDKLTKVTKNSRLLKDTLPNRDEGLYLLHEVRAALRQVSRQLPGSRGRRLFGTYGALEEAHSQITDALLSSYEQETGLASREPKDFLTVEASFKHFFAHELKYLGPLRDEPRPLYPLESLDNITDVGFKGEHTAAVLDLNRDQYVVSIDVNRFEQTGNFYPQRFRLLAAVSSWLSFLGVAEGVTTTDRGKIGHELQVSTIDVEKTHDLTNVGVGVSQVLPIVVMALLAGRGSLLIFEQPELHLHPKVQARLGDFFLAMSQLGKQCVVETHSEYLIERFRRRIAEDDEDQFSKLISVYFFEAVGGRTNVRKVDINEYGTILDWPPDFFDQAANETDRIIAAASAKRRRRKESSL